MIRWFNESIPKLEGTVLTMGNFDGMHLGHRMLINELIKNSRRLRAIPIILSYLEHPGHYVYFNHQIQILTPRIYKSELFKEMGIDKVYFLNFNSETAHISALEFLREVVYECFHPQLIISGYDTHFGYQREGNTTFLTKHEKSFGYQTLQIPPVYYQNDIISSTIIRQKLLEADIKTANAMLGRPYRLYGTVTYGIQLGRKIGFPTINLNLLDYEQLIPANGVYFTSLNIGDKHYFGLTNIGTSPTVKLTSQIEIETHILDFNVNVYDETIQLDLLEYVREEKRFADLDELKAAIEKDIKHCMGLKHKYE